MMLAGVSGAVSGCADARFVPSPFAPVDVGVTYSQQEDVTVLRWRLRATDLGSVRFLLEREGAWVPVDFEASVYPGGVTPCGDGEGSCAQIVLPGRYVASVARPVRSVHTHLGGFAGGEAAITERVSTLEVSAFFHPGNHAVETHVVDWIGGDTTFEFPRPLERAVWPTGGLCVPGGVPSDAVFVPHGNGTVEGPSPLRDAGFYCVAVRGVTRDGPPGHEAPVRIATLPEVQPADHVYRPTIETSPIVYQLVLDLEIPVADRCAAALAGIEAAVTRVLGSRGAPVHQMPTVNLSADGPDTCHQKAGRSLDATAMAQAVKKLVTSSFPERHHRYLLIYFQNLRAPLPDVLDASLTALRKSMAAPFDLLEVAWSLSPTEATSTFKWDVASPWLAADDPSFDGELRSVVDPTLPFRSELHDDLAPLALLDPAETQAMAGRRLKVCASTPTVTMLSRGQARPASPPSFVIETDDPPSYRVKLPRQIAVADSLFRQSSVLVRYEICSRYCDHPYRGRGGIDVASWTDSAACMEQSP